MDLTVHGWKYESLRPALAIPSILRIIKALVSRNTPTTLNGLTRIVMEYLKCYESGGRLVSTVFNLSDLFFLSN